MNQVSDKLVPKELAPFLPMAAAFLPGLGGGIMSQYLMPQLLTALSGAKMTGEIDPKAQAITGIMSALQGQTNAEKQFIEDNTGAFDQANQGALRDARFKELGGEYSSGDRSNFYRDAYDDFTLGPLSEKDITGQGGSFGERFGDSIKSGFDKFRGVDPEYGYNLVDGQGFADTVKGNKALNAYLDNLSGTPKGFEYLKAENVGGLTGDKFKDFFTGGDMDEKAYNKLFEKSAGEVGKFGTAIDKARTFMNADPGFNKATALKASLGATPYLMNQADIAARKIEEENAAADEANASYGDASSALSNYFINRDPNYNMLYGYNQGGLAGIRTAYNMGGMGSIPQTQQVPQGMQLNGQGGGFIPMGAQEKKDDVPAMLAKNEFVMTSDAVRAAGGGSIEKGAQRMYDMMNQLEAQV